MADPVRVKQLQCEGLANVNELIEQHKEKNIFLYFCGAIDETGESWCPDCRNAEKVVEYGLQQAKEGSVFILCVVGDKPKWKDPNNEFRVNSKFQLKCIPTLVKLVDGSPVGERLGDDDCQLQEKVDAFFKDN